MHLSNLLFLFPCFFFTCSVAEPILFGRPTRPHQNHSSVTGNETRDLVKREEEWEYYDDTDQRWECYTNPAPGRDPCFKEPRRIDECVRNGVLDGVVNGMAYHCPGTNKWYSFQWDAERHTLASCYENAGWGIGRAAKQHKRSARSSYTQWGIQVSLLSLSLSLFCASDVVTFTRM